MRTTIVYLAVAGILLASGCSGNGDDPKPTPAPVASATADPGVLPIIDNVIAAVGSADTAELETLLSYHTEICTTTPPGIGGPPVCATAEPDGAELEGMTRLSCEREFVRRADLNLDSAVTQDLNFYGVYAFDGFPQSAEHIILFERSSAVGGSIGMGYITDDTGVVALQYGCGWPTIEDFIDGNNLSTPIAARN